MDKSIYEKPKIAISYIESTDIIATSSPYENPSINDDAWA